MQNGYFRELVNFCGTPSAGRFAFLLSVILSNVVVWYVWLFVCVWTRTLVDIPVGVYTTYGLANGIAFGGKGIQSFAERPQTNSQSTYSTTTKTTTGDQDEDRKRGNSE
jgi:hypothetical protein